MNQKTSSRRTLEILSTVVRPDERARLHYWGYDPKLAASPFCRVTVVSVGAR